MEAPEVRYAQNAGVSIAYQEFGSGDHDLLFVCGTMSHLNLWWTSPTATAMLERLASFSRVILFDKPGTGLSDPIPAAPTLEQRTADLVAVLDAVDSDRAVIVGYSEGGVPSVALAATQPDRVESLVLLSTTGAFDWDESAAAPREAFDRVWSVADRACDAWGQGHLAAAMAPTWAVDEQLASTLGAIESACMSPGMARSVLQSYHGLDVRPLCPGVHVPTLVLHVEGDKMLPVELGRDLADRIDGATFVTLPGEDHMVWIGNDQSVPDAIERFVTGRAPGPRDDERVLATVVFTDIVDSTQRLAADGDAAWRARLAAHDRRLDDLVAHYDGRAVKHTGDGRLLRFDRPARAVRFAAEAIRAAAADGLEIRVGVHTGECEAKADGDLIGMAVNVAARVASTAGAGEVLVSSTVKDLVLGSGLEFTARGEHTLKGVPGDWPLYAWAGDAPGPLVATGYETDVRLPVEAPAL